MTDVKLVIPFGAHDTPIAHGGTDYQPGAYRHDITDPNSSWIVEVPPHVASHLTHNAGFYPMPQESEPQFSGTARLYAPYGCSCGGVSYHPDEDGIVTVPSAYVADLLAFPPICPETSRPDREPLPDRDVTEIATQLKMQRELDACHAHIAMLEVQLLAATQPAAEPAKAEVKAKPVRP